MGQGDEVKRASEDEDAARAKSKRSQTVSLVLLAGAGAAAIGLGALDPTQREEDVLVYADPEACVSAGIRTADDCRRDYAAATAAYPGAAPRYASLTDCESHHGAGHCLPSERVAPDARGQFAPRMAAYVVGRRADQALDPQPVFEHAPQQGTASAAAGGYGGYCTGWGGRVATSSGGRASSARVASSAVRTASFGGFGGTGRAFSSGGGHASHGGFGGG